MSPKRGHVTAKTTLRSAEVGVVVSEIAAQEEQRLARIARRTAVPGDERPWTRSSFYRAAIRFALENPNAFSRWVYENRDAR